MPGFVECSHVLPIGLKCQSPALRGKPFCHHHAKLHFRKPIWRKSAEAFPPALNDVHGLHVAVAKALTTLASPLTDTRRAGLLLYGLNIAASLLRRTPALSGDARQQSRSPRRRPPALTADR